MAAGKIDEKTLSELEELTRQTFMLWDEVRVGFSWRHYYMSHTLRVRAKALSIGREEGADPEALACAATLHDITKRYDGPYKVDENGKRVVNKDGLWVNEPLMPARRNVVTDLYDRMNLYFQVHHESGAAVAERLLVDRGISSGFAANVAHIIRGHLRPANPPWRLGGPDDPYRDPESCALFDADTIDANLGLVAFYRFVQIHGHRAIKAAGSLDLYRYVDDVRGWVERKEEFVTSRLTKTGREVAADRYRADRLVAAWLEEERATPERMAVAEEYGIMGLVRFFLKHHEDPDMNAELAAVKEVWLPERKKMLEAGEAPPGAGEALERVESFLRLIDREIRGEI